MLEDIIAPMRVAAALKGWHLADETIEEVRRVLKGDPTIKESGPELSDIYIVKETREAQISYTPLTAERIWGECWSHNYVAEVVCGNVVLRCSFCGGSRT